MSKKATELDALKAFGARAKAVAEKAAAAAAAGVTVPTKVSDLTNDSDFQTGTQVAASVTDATKDKADKATTLSGYGIEDAYTKDELDGKLSSVYKPGGSVSFSGLPAADEAHLGMVYNVTDAFTTTDNFVDGAGNNYPAGTNVVIIVDGEDYKFDVLAGFVDLSGLVEKENGKGLSSNDYTDAEKEKLADIEFATDEEVQAALDEVFGAQE